MTTPSNEKPVIEAEKFDPWYHVNGSSIQKMLLSGELFRAEDGDLYYTTDWE